MSSFKEYVETNEIDALIEAIRQYDVNTVESALEEGWLSDKVGAVKHAFSTGADAYNAKQAELDRKSHLDALGIKQKHYDNYQKNIKNPKLVGPSTKHPDLNTIMGLLSGRISVKGAKISDPAGVIKSLSGLINRIKEAQVARNAKVSAGPSAFDASKLATSPSDAQKINNPNDELFSTTEDPDLDMLHAKHQNSVGRKQPSDNDMYLPGMPTINTKKFDKQSVKKADLRGNRALDIHTDKELRSDKATDMAKFGDLGRDFHTAPTGFQSGNSRIQNQPQTIRDMPSNVYDTSGRVKDSETGSRIVGPNTLPGSPSMYDTGAGSAWPEGKVKKARKPRVAKVSATEPMFSEPSPPSGPVPAQSPSSGPVPSAVPVGQKDDTLSNILKRRKMA